MTLKAYLDSNILIAHRIGNHPFHREVTLLLDKLHKKSVAFAVSPLVIDEYLYGIITVQRAKLKQRKIYSSNEELLHKAVNSLYQLTRLKELVFDLNRREIKKTIELMGQYNLRPRDAFHLQIMRQNKIKKIITLDNDFVKPQKDGIIEIIKPNQLA